MKRVAIGIDMSQMFAHHYEVVEGIYEYARSRKWDCQVLSVLETSDDIPDLPGEFDGTPSLVAYCQAAKLPLINVHQDVNLDSVPTVFSDCSQWAAVILHHLHARGFHHFGFLGPLSQRVPQNLLKALREQFTADDRISALSVPVPRPSQMHEWQAYWRQLDDWLASLPKPSAVIGFSALDAQTVVQRCRHQGIVVPDDIALLTKSNDTLACEILDPPISALSHAMAPLGRAAAAALEQLMNGEPVPKNIVAHGPLKVIARRSTDVRAVEDRLVARALRYIWGRSHEPMFVDDVSRHLRVSRRSLEIRVRAALGGTINQEIVASRLRRAQRLLVDSDDSIKRIAAAAGFASSERMAQVFAQKLGQSPTSYRRSSCERTKD
jgi:LacI family transcriptional regulator